MYRYACAQLGARGEGGDYDEKQQLESNTTEMTVIVTGLAPYTSYKCTVYAFTKIGEGPGASVVGIIADDSELVNFVNLTNSTVNSVPGIVKYFTVVGQPPRTFKVYWRSPAIDNGEITRYTLTITFYTNDTIVYRENKTAVNNDDYYEYSPTVIALKQSNNVLYIEC